MQANSRQDLYQKSTQRLFSHIITKQSLCSNPFPQIYSYSRDALFQIIYLLEQDNKTLKQQVHKHFPQKQLSEIAAENQQHQLNEKMCAVTQDSLQKTKEHLTNVSSELACLQAAQKGLEEEAAQFKERIAQLEQQVYKTECSKNKKVQLDRSKIRVDDHETQEILMKLYQQVGEAMNSL